MNFLFIGCVIMVVGKMIVNSFSSQSKNYKKLYFNNHVPPLAITQSNSYQFRTDSSEIPGIVFWAFCGIISAIAFLFFYKMTDSFFDWIIAILAILGIYGITIGPLIHVGDKVIIKENKFELVGPRSSETIHLSQVDHIQLRYNYFQSSRGIASVSPEFIFTTGDTHKTMQLSEKIFLTQSKQILAALLIEYPEKSYSIKWNDSKKGDEVIIL
jgi:hypothetical protein